MARKPIPCRVCGKMFIPRSNTHKYCCPECQHTGALEQSRQWYRDNADRKHCNGPKSKATRKKLAECAKIANANHMSYGQAVAAGLFNKEEAKR